MELEERLAEALAFDAPYVIERLVKDRVAATPAEAQRLFTEAKRYLVLCDASPGATYGMYSSLVDAAWHTFILFTSEYTDYGRRYFGDYLHHVPAQAPYLPDDGETRPVGGQKIASFDDFRARYEQLYSEPMPPVWYDEACVTPYRRVFNNRAGALVVTLDDDTVHLADQNGDAVMSVSALAHDALAVIADNPAFYVRELPGGLTDDEKVCVIRSLVRCGVLVLAP